MKVIWKKPSEGLIIEVPLNMSFKIKPNKEKAIYGFLRYLISSFDDAARQLGPFSWALIEYVL